MNLEEILSWRNFMAENGHEFTPLEAKEICKIIAILRIEVESKLSEDPDYYENLKKKFELMTRAEKKEFLRTSYGESTSIKNFRDYLDIWFTLVQMIKEEQ